VDVVGVLVGSGVSGIEKCVSFYIRQ
jgi:hypothetical protein